MVIAWVFFLFVIGILYVKHENKALSVTMYKIGSNKLPMEFDGLKLVCLSDLHNNQFGRNNCKLIKRIDDFSPDYIISAGDMITSNDVSKIHISLELFTGLAARYKIIYAFGNHESRAEMYMENLWEEEYLLKLKEAGVIILRNSYIEIEKSNKKIRIYGIELPLALYRKNIRKKNTDNMVFDKKSMEVMLGRPDKNMYNILSAHFPNYFNVYSEWGADLVFSGHIHGGVMIMPCLGGVISPLYEFFPKYDYGRFEENGSNMLLSKGLGTHTIPIRIFNRPELICVELCSGHSND